MKLNLKVLAVFACVALLLPFIVVGVVTFALPPQYTQTFLGRRRYLPGIASQDWGRRSFGERCALNTPIQGTAADILKLALGRLIEGLPERPWLRPLLQIHDELVNFPPTSLRRR